MRCLFESLDLALNIGFYLSRSSIAYCTKLTAIYATMSIDPYTQNGARILYMFCGFKLVRLVRRLTNQRKAIVRRLPLQTTFNRSTGWLTGCLSVNVSWRRLLLIYRPSFRELANNWISGHRCNILSLSARRKYNHTIIRQYDSSQVRKSHWNTMFSSPKDDSDLRQSNKADNFVYHTHSHSSKEIRSDRGFRMHLPGEMADF